MAWLGLCSYKYGDSLNVRGPLRYGVANYVGALIGF